MELVYLWVEKNDLIEGTDFNFGSKYIFSFEKNDEKKGVLSVEENPSFIENFYTDKISISAIVGKNGTGKSQLLKLIWNNDFQKKYFAIIFNDGYYELICAIYNKGFFNNGSYIFPDKIHKEYYISLEEDSRKIDNLTSLFYTNEGICENMMFNHKSITKNIKFLSKECYLKKIIDSEIKATEGYDLVKRITNKSLAGRIDIDMSIQYEKLKYILDSELFEKILNIIYDNSILWYTDMNKPDTVKILSSRPKLISSVAENRQLKILLEENYSLNQIVFLYYTYSWFTYIQKEENIPIEIRESYKNIYDEYRKDNFNNKKTFLKKMIEGNLYYEENNNDIYFSTSKKFFTLLKQLDEELLKIENLNNIVITDENKFIIDIVRIHTSLIKEGINIAPILQYELYPKMSSGNFAVMQTFAMLYDKINDIKDDNILLLLDEVEVYLHPDWQKRFLKLLIGFLSSKFQDKNFHIILATHSPFLLSDIPKSNVVFLGGDDEVRIERTFGANIHTLLSDSFFMEDGLMGEFAKDKIEDIMDFLNDEKKIEEISTKEEHIKQVIESIGEDLLRKKLLFMYYEKLENEELEKEKQQLLEKKEEIIRFIESIEEKQNK